MSGHGFCFQELMLFWGDRLGHSQCKAQRLLCGGEALHSERGWCWGGRWRSTKVAEGSSNWVLRGPVGKARSDRIPDREFQTLNK